MIYMRTMQLKFYKPKNEILKKYVEGYYFMQEDSASGSFKYRTFPNNYTIVTVMQDISLKHSDSKMIINPSKKNGIYSNIVYRYNSPIEIFYEKPANEITIYFKPLGINFFVKNAEVFYSQDHTRAIEFCPFSDFKSEMIEILNLPDREKQIDRLEDYWMAKYIEKDFSLMKSLIKAIETDTKIEGIAQNHNISRQYLNRLFQKNIGKSATEYRKIHRFRKSIAEKNEVRSLTELSHDNLFYDQSHFIKDFRDLTHKTPTSFFRKVDVEKEIVWLFI